MEKTFTREELYRLVWSEPMRLLAKKYEISDRGLAKACQHADTPVPERGYWNKLQAGKKVTKCPLPARGIGKSGEVTIGSSYRYYGRQSDHEKALTMIIPPPPEFTEDIENVKTRVKAMVDKVKIPKTMSEPHRLISALLDKDEVRRQKVQASEWNWDKPIFDTPFEHRRLKILNSIFTALEMCGMKPSLDGKEARGLAIVVGDQWVRFTLDSSKASRSLEREKQGYGFTPRDNGDPMILRFSSNPEKTWQDSDADKIEDHLREIVEEIIIAGEVYYRDWASNHHKWLIERKANAEENERKYKEELEQARLEQIRKHEEQCVHNLLDQASNLGRATTIRNYVDLAQQANAASDRPLPMEEFEEWSQWALVQADRIDPVKTGAFRTRPPLPEEPRALTEEERDDLDSGLSDHDLGREPGWFQKMNSWPRKRP